MPKHVMTAGTPLEEAESVLVMIHGRGGTAEDILTLADEFPLEDAAIFAPQATGNTWYPYSFMAPVAENQPALDLALAVVDDIVEEIVAAGIAPEHIYFAGFSQGACLTLEYVTRHARQYAGIIAFTGGLIGARLDADNYKGNFGGTPVLITTGDPDPHVPLARVQESAAVLKGMGADVTVKVYKGRPHTITRQEIDTAARVIFG